MALDYNAKLTAIKNVFVNNNTTTSSVDLGSGLTVRVDDSNIRLADIDTVSLRAQDFPLVFIRVASKDEQFETLGNTGLGNNLKSCVINYDIVGMARKEGMHNTNDELSKDVNQLADNIEGVIRQNMTLSGTAKWCNTPDTTFTGAFENNGIFVKGVLVNLQAKYFFK
ncbi:MAG: hypothetical protein KAJ48_08030 [Elusimicrobiales bacterium]|nr:hypothetical protein [Elusimicrobiales bacterium]